ncbi:M24 family metallopeptidase [Acetanaerobacterium elongatum]|uniref:Xaa-Pro aminopeptidase n=1 Tax=Acetanaerobacterium elongatum TaxID=258515 RepID=A0A1H0DYS0_9FIRM|nr:M24 family metallopeptidase [Acetanaerobacterium elongatum]SDN75334.1 Xaa-Pro aminopeptidase [Acetanaerobacterium elongatum]
MNITPSITELESRLDAFRTAMDTGHPNWQTAIILSKVNQYYFTGTMQDALLMIKRGGEAFYMVRRSLERAKNESPLPMIYSMEGYRDAAALAGAQCGETYLETEVVTVGILERLKKYFNFASVGSLDKTLLFVRAVKTPYELYWSEYSGSRHHKLLTEIVPAMLTEGMSEADLVAELYEQMVKHEYQGISRFAMFQTEMVVGQVGFGENSLYPTSFDGPGGAKGMYPASPLGGNRERRLKKGDLVFIDIAFAVNGYHSDKTQVYMFGGKPNKETIMAHCGCKEVQKRLAEQLKPGAIPSKLYQTIMEGLSDDFKRNFMGYGSRQVKFLGHGIGLHIDEMPVIAKGFDTPLAENMLLALEPKKGVAGVGMVGVEDTYVVTSEGGRCITGGGEDIIVI